MKNILVTGGAGFIGSHFAKLMDKDPRIRVTVLDKMTYAADISRLEGFKGKIIVGDVCDGETVKEILRSYEIDTVVHFAAQSHVDRSLMDAGEFTLTNVYGTQMLADACESYWSDSYEDKLFVHISTDEVYGDSRFSNESASEESAMNPTNPYAATKAAADTIMLSKMRSTSFPAIILRSSNNFGKGQHKEKFIPKVAYCIKNEKPIPVYGKGTNRRCWLSVEDYCEAISSLIDIRPVGEIFNIKGNEIYDNKTLVEMIMECSPKNAQIIHVEDRKMHDTFYDIDDSKVKRLLGDYNKRSLKQFIQSGNIFK